MCDGSEHILSPYSVRMTACCQQWRSCPWVRGQEGVTVACCVGSRSQGQGEQLVSRMASGMYPRELMQLNLHPVFPQLPLCCWGKLPKRGRFSRAKQYELWKMLSLCRFGSCIQILRGAARRDFPRQACR